MKRIFTWSLAIALLWSFASCEPTPAEVPDEIYASVESVDIPTIAQSASFTVFTNFLWDYEVTTSDGGDWISISFDPADKVGRVGLFTVTLKLTDNTGLEDREADIRFYVTTRSTEYVVKVKQPGAIANQRGLLMTLYNALDGPNWANSTKWGSDDPIADWEGVTVGEDGMVTGLNLSKKGLNGQLPAEIGLFPSLTSLNLGSNPNLTGALPELLGNLTNIESFVAVTTGLSGNLPKSMGNWKKVTNIQLNTNNIEGAIPAEWAGMTAIKSFGMYGTKISSVSPAIFPAWKHIGSILLNKNPNLTGNLPAAVGSITTDNTNLSIWFHECNFTGGIPEEWANIPAVSKQLRVYGNQLTEPVPYSIQKHSSWTTDRWNSGSAAVPHYIRTQQNDVFLPLALPTQTAALLAIYNATDGENWTKKANWATETDIATWQGVTVVEGLVTKLNLNGFGLNGTLPEEIGNLTSLTSLNIGGNAKLTGPLPESMGKLVNMDSFLAVKTGLSGTLPKSMGKWNKLTNIQLNDNKITGEIPTEWSGMVSLKSFGMYSTLINSIPENIFPAWKHIGSILLNKNPNLTGSLPISVGNITTDNTNLSIWFSDCNFTGSIPQEWANIPEVSKQLRVYGNKLTEPVPYAIHTHKCWTADRWDSGSAAVPHYVRSQQNDVYLDLATNAPVLITIAQARALDASEEGVIIDSRVKIKGVVTSDVTAVNLADGNMFIQDASGAIALRFTEGHNYAMGTELEISLLGATRAIYNELDQISGLTTSNIVNVNTNASMPEPVLVTPEQLATGDYEGQLVVLNGMQFTATDVVYSGSRQIANTTGGTVNVYTRNAASFSQEIVAAGNGPIIGNASTFNGVQLILRNLDDVSAMTGVRFTPWDNAVLKTIAEVLAMDGEISQDIKIKGVVISDVANGNLSKGNIYIQDATAGILLYFGATDHTIAMGSEIEVWIKGGERAEYRGMQQIKNITAGNVIANVPGTMPSPIAITPAQFLNGDHQGKLVKLSGMQFKDIAKTYNGNQTIANEAGDEIIVYTTSYATFAGETVAQGNGDIIGIAISYNTTRELSLRNLSDVAGMTGTRFTVTPPPATTGAPLFISEYVEGSSNNKYIEIHNPTNDAVTMVGYKLVTCTNGATEWSNNKTELDAITIPAKGTIVIAHTQANDELYAGIKPSTNNGMNFNGNDAVGLFYNDTLLDIVGALGDSSYFAKDVTLQRKAGVTQGSTTYNAGDWTSLAQDTFSGLGSY